MTIITLKSTESYLKKLNQHNLHFSSGVSSTLDGYDMSQFLLNQATIFFPLEKQRETQYIPTSDSTSYLITQSLFGWKVKGADNGIMLLQLFMQRVKLSITSIDIPLIVTYTNVNLQNNITKSQARSLLHLALCSTTNTSGWLKITFHTLLQQWKSCYHTAQKACICQEFRIWFTPAVQLTLFHKKSL